MRPLPLIISAAILAAHSVVAAPYCDALADPEAIGNAYKRIAPIYSDSHTGWIFARDQLRQDYALNDSTVSLLTQVVAEVRARGAELAILIAPPRPIVAAGIAGAATLPAEAEFDAAAASGTFHRMISQINGTGALAPDLLHLLEDRPDLAARYYFSRDTHWTHEGAAESAVALARRLTEAGVPGLVADHPHASPLSTTHTYTEKGSLSQVVAKVCALALAPEIVPTVDFPASSTETGLLGDTTTPEGPRIALVGTSFSNRNQRDAYRVADALAYATGREVDNFSVSGGGALSAIESYILSGALDAGSHDILVWEAPYTTALRSASGLRQLLGALRAGAPRRLLAETSLPDTGTADLEIPTQAADTYLVEILTAKPGAQKVRGRVIYDNGSSTKVMFHRSARMPQVERDKPLRMTIDGSAKRRPVAIEVTFDPDHAAGGTLSVHALNQGPRSPQGDD
ncbi:MAG: hypothetical protein AAGB05_16585 [Pseudomonadota bacterium]